jgi:hypothetical protein
MERPRSEFRNINLERLDTEEGVNQVLDAVSVSTENAGYNPRPLTETAENAGALDERAMLGTLMRRKPGQTLNDAQLTRARQLMVASAEQLQDWGRALQVKGRANVTDLELIEYQRALQRHTVLQTSVQGAIRETARALSALRLVPDRLDPQAIEAALQGGGGPDAIFQKALLIADAPTVEEASKKAGAVSWLGRAAENLVYYRTMSLLSGPRTHVVNAVSNSLVNLLALPERALAGAISQTLGSGQVYAAEAGQMFYGDVNNLLDAFRLAGKAWKTGDSVFGQTKIETDTTIHSASEYGLEHGDPMAMAYDWAASAVSAPGRALTAADEFYKTLAFNQQARALAYRVARGEGKTGQELAERIEEILAGPNQEKILEGLNAQGLTGDERDLAFMAKLSAEERQFQQLYRESVQFSRYQTFSDSMESGIGKGLAQVHRSSPAVRLIVPFYRTPANILSYAVERSPMFAAAPNFWRSIQKGGAARDEAMARAVMGSAIAAWAISASTDGTLSGAGPSNPQLRKVYEAAGWKPYTLTVGDEAINYDRLEPVTTPLAVIADMAEAYRYATSDKQREHILVVMTASLAEAMNDKAMLTGLSDLVDALAAAQSGGKSGFTDRLVQSFLPYSSFQRSARNALDPERKQTEAGGPLESALNYVRNSIPIPVLYEDLPPMVDFWGAPMDSQDFIGPDMLSPFYMAKYQDDDATYALAQNGVAPSAVPCEMSVQGVRVDLHELDIGKGTGQACYEYRQLVGQERRSAVQQVIGSKGYSDPRVRVGGPQDETATVVTRGDLLQLALSQGKQAGTAKFVQRYQAAVERVMVGEMSKVRPVSPPPAFIEKGRDRARMSKPAPAGEPKF